MKMPSYLSQLSARLAAFLEKVQMSSRSLRCLRKAAMLGQNSLAIVSTSMASITQVDNVRARLASRELTFSRVTSKPLMLRYVEAIYMHTFSVRGSD